MSLRGSALRIKQGGSVIALATSCKISLTTNTEDATTKDDTEGWDYPYEISKSWSVTVDKLIDLTGSAIDADKASFLADTNLTLSWTVGGYTFEGDAILSGNTITAENKQNMTSSLTFTGNGEINYEEA